MLSTRAVGSSEEIWLEVERRVRKAHVKVVVPMPVAISVEAATAHGANWTMFFHGLKPENQDAVIHALAEVQSGWTLLDEKPPAKPTRSAVELRALVHERISKLPSMVRVPEIGVDAIVWREYAGGGQANWSVPSITGKRNCRQDVALVIGAIQRQFDLAIG